MWKIYTKQQINDKHWDQWQLLNQTFFHQHPLLDVKFLRPLLECFASDDVILAISEQDDGVNAALFLEKTGFGVWQLFSPSQCSIAPMLFHPEVLNQSTHYLQSLAQQLPGPVLMIAFLKLDPDYLDLKTRLPSNLYEYILCSNTINIDVRGSFDDYWRERGKKQRQNIKRPLKKLEQDNISLQLQVQTRVEDMPNAIQAHGHLESSGWKGDEGTAIHKDNIQGIFYARMLENFALENKAYTCQLCADNKNIASLLNIHQNGMMVVLKTSYLESMADYSPGRLIDYFMLPDIFNDSAINTVEHYTNASKTDEKWATGRREIYHLNYFPTKRHKWLVRLLRTVKNGLRRLPAQ